jgi:nucleoside-diphosphate-sugar epimerase
LLTTENQPPQTMNKKLKIVVIGGSGLIGSKVVNGLERS